MFRSLPISRFLAASLGLHLLGLVALYYLLLFTAKDTPLPTPVNIVNLPKEVLKRLPSLERPVQVPVPREISKPHGAVPAPKKFGAAQDVAVPKTSPSAPGGGQGGTGKGAKAGTAKPGAEKGPLPFLSQADIDELARKGMPARKPGDESVTLDTDEFKFISYNRWLKFKVESALRYPELAALSGYQGVLYIKFDILKDGSLDGLELLQSSGYKILDDEALNALRSVAPFQRLPDEWGMERYSIRAAVLFYLNSAYIR